VPRGADYRSGAARILEAGVTHLSGECGEPAPLRGAGFREIGIYRRHGKLDGRWMDCVIVERLLD